MGRNDRFQIICTQGITDITRILLDTRVRVLYLQTVSSYAGGLTLLLDNEGRSMKWPLEEGGA